MTTNTQHLRGLLEHLPNNSSGRHVAVRHSPKRIGFGLSNGPSWFIASEGPTTDTSDVQAFLSRIGQLLDAYPAILDKVDTLRNHAALLKAGLVQIERENDALRAELCILREHLRDAIDANAAAKEQK